MLRVPMLLLVVTVSQAATPVFKASLENWKRSGQWITALRNLIPATSPSAWSGVPIPRIQVFAWRQLPSPSANATN